MNKIIRPVSSRYRLFKMDPKISIWGGGSLEVTVSAHDNDVYIFKVFTSREQPMNSYWDLQTHKREDVRLNLINSSL